MSATSAVDLRNALPRRMDFYALWIAILSVLMGAFTSLPAYACAFHFNTELPEASLSQQLASSNSIVAARSAQNDPYRFGSTRLLKGSPTRLTPPHLVDTVTRRQFATSPDHEVLFALNAEGIWTRLLMLDDTTRPIIAEMLAKTDVWNRRAGSEDRRDFAARLLAHPDQRIRHIALRELDALAYQTLRAGTYQISTEYLLQRIADPTNQPFSPIQIQLLGIIGGESVSAEINDQLHQRLTSGTGKNLGALTVAALELNGEGAIDELEALISDRAKPFDKAQIDEIVQAFALQAAAGAPSLRGPARMALLNMLRLYPDTSFIAKAQALVSTVFTSAMTGMTLGFSTSGSLVAVLIAFLYGAVHTLGPGHGKAVVISHFAGSGGSFRRGLIMGTQIAITHVFSAIVLVFLFDFAVRQTTGSAPSDYRLIRLASYAAIIVIGTAMLWRAIKTAIEQKKHHMHHHHTDGCASCAAAAERAGKGAGLLATAIGVVPCTGALMVMLYGLANDLVGPAIVMVVAISAGMALAMAGIGTAAILGNRLATARWTTDAAQKMRFTSRARIAGAGFVLLVGVSLFLTTLFSPLDGFGSVADGRDPNFKRTVQLDAAE